MAEDDLETIEFKGEDETDMTLFNQAAGGPQSVMSLRYSRKV